MILFDVIVSNLFFVLKTYEKLFFFENFSSNELKKLSRKLQSLSRSFPSFVPLLNFNDLRLNDPPVGAGACVPRRSKNGLTFAIGRRC